MPSATACPPASSVTTCPPIPCTPYVPPPHPPQIYPVVEHSLNPKVPITRYIGGIHHIPKKRRACDICGTHQEITVHHVYPRWHKKTKAGFRILLCQACHSRLENKIRKITSLIYKKIDHPDIGNLSYQKFLASRVYDTLVKKMTPDQRQQDLSQLLHGDRDFLIIWHIIQRAIKNKDMFIHRLFCVKRVSAYLKIDYYWLYEVISNNLKYQLECNNK